MTDTLLAKIQAALAAVEHRPYCSSVMFDASDGEGGYELGKCTCDWQARVAHRITAAIEAATVNDLVALDDGPKLQDAAVAAFQERAK